MIFWMIFLVWYMPLGLFWLVPMFCKRKTFSANFTPKNRFSIIIVHREEENLPKLLKDIENIDYPKDLWEVILIEDGNQVSSQLPSIHKNHQYISANLTSASPKKEAITLGIQKSKFEWIITTDADVKIPKNWLQTFDREIQQNQQPILLAAPVFIVPEKSLLNHYQQWDFISLQSVTMAGFYWNKPLMCNGANLCFSKEFFEQSNGYQGSEHLASGDDVFLLFKAWQKHPNQVRFVHANEAFITTYSVKTWKNLIEQRVRWASKMKSYTNLFPLILGIHLVLSQFIFWGSLISFFSNFNSQWLVIVCTKLLLDGTLQISAAWFWKQSPKNFLMSWWLYPIITVWVFIQSLQGKYTWKNRSYVTSFSRTK